MLYAMQIIVISLIIIKPWKKGLGISLQSITVVECHIIFLDIVLVQTSLNLP